MKILIATLGLLLLAFAAPAHSSILTCNVVTSAGDYCEVTLNRAAVLDCTGTWDTSSFTLHKQQCTDSSDCSGGGGNLEFNADTYFPTTNSDLVGHIVDYPVGTKVKLVFINVGSDDINCTWDY